MIALSHLLLAGIMIGVAAEAPVSAWMGAAVVVALVNFALFVRAMPDPMELLD